MEKRAREREEKHAMIRERRRQMEEDRVRLKQQVQIVKNACKKITVQFIGSIKLIKINQSHIL